MFDTVGTVRSTAGFVARGAAHQLDETSQFTRVDGRWLYVTAAPTPT